MSAEELQIWTAKPRGWRKGGQAWRNDLFFPHIGLPEKRSEGLNKNRMTTTFIRRKRILKN